MDRAGVETGADADDQPTCIRVGRPAWQDRGKAVPGQAAQRISMGLKVIHQPDPGNAGVVRQPVRIQFPCQIGRMRPPAGATLDDAGNGNDSGLGRRRPPGGQRGGNHRLRPVEIGIGKAADRVLLHPAAAGQRQTGIGAADIGNQDQDVAWNTGRHGGSCFTHAPS